MRPLAAGASVRGRRGADMGQTAMQFIQAKIIHNRKNLHFLEPNPLCSGWCWTKVYIKAIDDQVDMQCMISI